MQIHKKYDIISRCNILCIESFAQRKIYQKRSEKQKASVKIIKSHCKIVTSVCCAVALFLMIPIIIINTIFIVQIYILKEEVPNICGYFPLISLEEEASIRIEKGDFIICRKFDDDDLDNIDEIMKGKLVTHCADDSRSTMCIAPLISVDGNDAIMRSPRNQSYKIPVDEVVCEYRFSIPLLGYVIYFLSTIPGFLICVVIPTIVLTELYLYKRRKDFASEEDEESILLAELEALKTERESLISQIENKPSEMNSQNSNSQDNELR